MIRTLIVGDFDPQSHIDLEYPPAVGDRILKMDTKVSARIWYPDNQVLQRLFDAGYIKEEDISPLIQLVLITKYINFDERSVEIDM